MNHSERETRTKGVGEEEIIITIIKKKGERENKKQQFSQFKGNGGPRKKKKIVSKVWTMTEHCQTKSTIKNKQ